MEALEIPVIVQSLSVCVTIADIIQNGLSYFILWRILLKASVSCRSFLV